MGERQIWNYIKRADELVLSRRGKRHTRVLALHMSRREALYARAVNAADYRTALAVVGDLAKLQGLYASDRDLRELLKLAAEQGRKIGDLEARLADAARPAGDAPAE